MSSHSPDTKRITTADIAARKGGEKIVALTAYTAPVAHILDAHVDVLLVGDSLGMVVYGMETTLGVTLEMMIAHGRAVARASARACVIVDMPFGSYQASGAQAFENCAKVMAQTGAQGVKLEGGAEMAETIRFLTERGIPVMGHVGMMPQRVHAYGGFKQQGKNAAQAEAILADAKAVADAGAFSLVLEAIPEALAEKITAAVAVPTIGIGAGPQCDGQVLVVDDMMGLTARTPKFVKRYAEMGGVLEKAVRDYVEDVRKGRFP